jgi:hypothetical protein
VGDRRLPPPVTLDELDRLIAAGIAADEAKLGEDTLARVERLTWGMYRRAAREDAAREA